MVVSSVCLVLLWGSSADASRSGNVRTHNYERHLKDDKKAKSVYSVKSCKSDKKGYDCIEDATQIPVNIDIIDDNSNNTDVEVDIIFVDTPHIVYKSKAGKSEKKEKSDKKEKSEKTEKSVKSEKTEKSVKSGKKSKSTPIIEESPDPDPVEVGFVPEEVWSRTFKDAVGTGFLFYDSVTKYAWYAYNAEAGDSGLTSVSSAETVDGTAQAVTTQAVASSATIGRICPMDTANKGKVMETLCINIKAPEEWKTVTSTMIQTVEACYGTVTGSIFKLAVVVKDSTKVLHLDDVLVGSRMLVYDIVVGGKSGGTNDIEPIIVEVAYEGWLSLYGEPTINGRPSFSADCQTVYATWLTPGEVTPDEAVASELVSAVTIATDIQSATKDGDSSEVWRLGTSTYLVGLTPSKDGKTLIAGTNTPDGDTLSTGGIVALNANTGKITEEYDFPTNDAGYTHNAYTNLVMDDSENTYHIDSLLGLVKFDSKNLANGPVWSALKGATEVVASESAASEMATEVIPEKDAAVETDRQGTRILVPKDSELMGAEQMAFTAFQPALDESDFATVYGCGNNVLGSMVDGVTALGATNGTSVWFADMDDSNVLNVGSCSSITDDIVWAPSAASSSGNGVHIAMGKAVQALDSKDGSGLWMYTMDGNDHTKFVVVSEGSVLVANTGTVALLNTIESGPPVVVPNMTPTPAPIGNTKPTRSPLSTPSPVQPLPVTPPTLVPTSSASTRGGLSFATAVLSALPLLLVLLR